MKVAFVTPRYGLTIFGGAENAARQLAERLVARPGWDVEVLTTCAVDHTTWRDVLPAGASMINGVVVRRFPSVAGRNMVDEAYARVISNPGAASFADAARWVRLQGPVVPELVQAVVDCDADVIAFYPYPYYPTVHAIGRVHVPAVLHPAAHNEPMFHLSVYKATFRSADAFVYHTVAERSLVERHHPVADRPQLVLGLGVDEPAPPSGNDVRDVDGRVLGDRPYVVSLGRVDPTKGSRYLIEAFRRFKERHPGPLALVLVGIINEPVPPDPDIVVTGPVSEQEKWDVLRGAIVSVSPSPYESFSLAVMESAMVDLPVLVNGICGPTREFCEQSGGGLWFTSYDEFERCLERLLADAELRVRLGQAGREFVRARYRWPVLIDRYAAFLGEVSARGRHATPFADVAFTE